MNEFSKWVTECLDTKEDIQGKLKPGDLVKIVELKDESNICEFLGYEHCKWIDYVESCYNCKGKFSLRDTVTDKNKVLCGTSTIGKKNYSRIKIIEQNVLPEDLFEI